MSEAMWLTILVLVGLFGIGFLTGKIAGWLKGRC